MSNLVHVLTRIIHQPLLCDPAYLEVVMSVLAERGGFEPMSSSEVMESYKRPAKSAYFDERNRLAVLPIVGGLVHRSEYMNPASGMTGYTSIHDAITAEVNSSRSRAILLDVDSPGGEVAGLQELASFIAEAKKEKPIYAIANSLMASAAYWMSSAATAVYAVPQSAVGSIGVITAHVDRSKEIDKKGQKVTLIAAGKHKTAGNPYEPLPDDVRESVQRRVDALYGDFVGAVAQARGIDEAVVRRTEAGVFSPADAKEIGLIDGEMSLGDAFKVIGSRSRPSMVGYTAERSNMAEKALYGDSDLANARSEGHAAGVSEAKVGNEAATAKALKAQSDEFATAIAALFPENARAETFVDALNDGASVALATKVAMRVGLKPEAAAAPVDDKAARTRDIDRVMGSVSPNVPAEGTTAGAAKSKEDRVKELTAAAQAVNAQRGYSARAR